MSVSNGRYPVKGWRKVSVHGTLKFEGFYYYHTRLLPFAGSKVWCENTDVWSGSPVKVWTCEDPRAKQYICEAESVTSDT